MTVASGVLEPDHVDPGRPIGKAGSLAVAFSFSLPDSVAPATASFSGNASGGTGPYTFNWSFGDGGTATGANATYTYLIPGSYVVLMRALDQHGLTGATTHPLTVDYPLKVTLAVFPLNGTAPLSVACSSSVSSGNPPYSFNWSFGDGGASTLPNPSHIFLSGGTFTVSLLVTDQAGLRVTRNASILVVSTPSTGTPTPGFPTPVELGLGITLAGAASGGAIALWWLHRRRTGGGSAAGNP
ncbi:MAG: PKD domain-containing protein [Candidatus Lutacidiplasmatales archaeon]